MHAPRLVRLLRYIALGAATSVVLAWGLWPRRSPHLPSMLVIGGVGTAEDKPFTTRAISLDFGEDRTAQCTRRQRTGYRLFALEGYYSTIGSGPSKPNAFSAIEAREVVRDPASHRFTGGQSRNSAQIPADFAWPAWARGMPSESRPLTSWSVAASGWPLLCLTATSWVPEGKGREVAGELRWSVTRPWTDGVLPASPIWTGLASDTAIYAVPWWVIGTVLLTARRTLRLRRNLCPSCGYSLAGLPQGACPECGAKVQAIGRPR